MTRLDIYTYVTRVALYTYRLRLRSGDMLLWRSRLRGDTPRYLYICDTRRYVYISIEIEEQRHVAAAQQAAR